jgi:hypothetical protein
VLSLTHGLITFGLELAGLAVAVGAVLVLLERRVSGSDDRRLVVVAVLAVAVIAAGFRNLDAAGSALQNAHRSSFGSRRGIDFCAQEDGAGSRVPFVEWLRERMPPHALYALYLSGQPDVWCLTLTLLPRLPVRYDAHPGWVVAFGTIPPALQARIARHDRSVQVFAPGLALARGVT